MKFRNIDVTPDDPVDTWGVEGMLIALERGDIFQWRRIAATVQDNPCGAAALDLEEALAQAQSPGPVALLARVLNDARVGAKATVIRRLKHAVRRTGMTLRQFAPLVGTSYSRLSTYLSGDAVPSAALAWRIEQVGTKHAL